MVDVLAVRGLSLLGLNHSLLLGAVADGARDGPLRLRALLLDPDSAAARQRAVEIGESPESFASGIRFMIARLHDWLRSAANLEVACYDQLPVWRLIGIDSTVYVGTFAEAWEGPPVAVVQAHRVAGGGCCSVGCAGTLEDLRQHAKPIIWMICG